MACSTSQLLRYFKVENGARRALAHAAIRQKGFAIAYGHVRVLDSKISAEKKSKKKFGCAAVDFGRLRRATQAT